MIKKCLPLLLIGCLLLSGCGNIFISEQTPFAVKKPETADEQAAVTVREIGKGKITDYYAAKKMLLTTDEVESDSPANHLNIYRSAGNEWTPSNIIYSNNTVSGAVFDNDAGGIFTIEKNPDGRQHILWTSLDRTFTKNISKTDENVVSASPPYVNNAILYQTDQNDFIITDTEGKRQSFTMNGSYHLSELCFDADRQVMYFTAAQADGNDYDLYCLYLDKLKENMMPIRLAKNVADFSVKSDGTLLLILENGDQSDICTMDPVSRMKHRILRGKYTNAIYSADEKWIIAAKYTEADDPSFQTIHAMKTDGSEEEQISGPLAINSKLYISEDNQHLYFSADVHATISVEASRESVIFDFHRKEQK